MEIRKFEFEKITEGVKKTQVPEGMVLTQEQAIQSAIDRANKFGYGTTFDIDDTFIHGVTCLLMYLEKILGAPHIHSQEFVSQWGIFEKATHLQEAARKKNIDLDQLISRVFADPNIYASMPVIMKALRFIEELEDIPIIAFITARPEELNPVTAASLAYYNIGIGAPIINTTPPGVPMSKQISKRDILETILSHVTDLRAPIIHVDDHYGTVHEIAQRIPRNLCVPILIEGYRSRAATRQGKNGVVSMDYLGAAKAIKNLYK